MNKYVNEMEDYLYNHNYISRNKNKDPLRQQELSTERASCIVQKYRTLTEEKDKEIERLTAESTEWESKCYKYQDIINELEKHLLEYLDEWQDVEDDFVKGRCLMARDVIHDIYELKEGK